MADTARMDQVYHLVLSGLVERGQAPHYTEIARALSVAPEAGKALLHDLLATGVPGWVHPGTDLLASLGPFNNLPTHYRISVRGEQR
ncbi:MAG TPA: hypothetical protein VGC20_18175, partial [bacterium]